MVNPVENNIEDVSEENLKLRRAIHKLKVDNSRIRNKLKSITSTVRQLVEVSGKKHEIQPDAIEADTEYDEIGRDYILIGGPNDPFSIRYEVLIKDAHGHQHKSAERYYWYKKAEHFSDPEAMKIIHESETGIAAEKAMKAIKNVDEKAWDKVKLAHWEEAQRLKLLQVRWIANLLLASGTTYMAIASRDKIIGTGWNKKREESAKSWKWDGENLGGKFFMNYRQQLKQVHKWLGPNEEKEAQDKFKELRKIAWRRGFNKDKDQPRRISVIAKRGGRVRSAPSGTFPRKSQANVTREAIRPFSSLNLNQAPQYQGNMSQQFGAPLGYTYGAPAQGYQWM